MVRFDLVISLHSLDSYLDVMLETLFYPFKDRGQSTVGSQTPGQAPLLDKAPPPSQRAPFPSNRAEKPSPQSSWDPVAEGKGGPQEGPGPLSRESTPSPPGSILPLTHCLQPCQMSRHLVPCPFHLSHHTSPPLPCTYTSSPGNPGPLYRGVASTWGLRMPAGKGWLGASQER